MTRRGADHHYPAMTALGHSSRDGCRHCSRCGKIYLGCAKDQLGIFDQIALGARIADASDEIGQIEWCFLVLAQHGIDGRLSVREVEAERLRFCPCMADLFGYQAESRPVAPPKAKVYPRRCMQ